MGYFSDMALHGTIGEAREDGLLDSRNRVKKAARTAPPVRLIGRWDSEAIWTAMRDARSSGSDSVNRVPNGLNCSGGASDETLARATACRACGQTMGKGSAAIQFGYRWDTYRFRIVTAYLHPTPCRWVGADKWQGLF